MSNLGETADSYESQKTKNVADLEFVKVDEQAFLRTGKDKDGKPFKYNVIVREDTDYRIAPSVFEAIKSIRARNKSITMFQVAKSGEGMSTKYSVIPLIEKSP